MLRAGGVGSPTNHPGSWQRLQGNALLWSQFVLGWVQQNLNFGSSDRRLLDEIHQSFLEFLAELRPVHDLLTNHAMDLHHAWTGRLIRDLDSDYHVLTRNTHSPD